MKYVTINEFLKGGYVIRALETNVRLLLQVDFPNYLQEEPMSMEELINRWGYIETLDGMIHYRRYSGEPHKLICTLLSKVK